MRLPCSLYEAVVRGFGGSGDVAGRRALFLFVVDHSSAMQRPFEVTGRSRIESVVEALGDMKREMAELDGGDHLDVGFVGYPFAAEDATSGSMWADGVDRGVVRQVADASSLRTGPLESGASDGVSSPFDVAREEVARWLAANEAPLFPPVVLHVVASEGPTIPGIEEAAGELTGVGSTRLFHCCFDERACDQIVVPRREDVPVGLAAQLFDVSSEMPRLVEDVGELLLGRVTPGMRDAAARLAETRGLPRGLGELGADLLGRAMGGGLPVPVAPGWTRTAGARVEGLRIDSPTGFALVRGMVGFRLFTQLFN